MEIKKTNLQSLQEQFSDPAKRALDFEGAGVDDHLQTIVKLLNLSSDFGISVGITIYTATGIITGQLISSNAYFKKFGETFVGAFAAKFPENEWSALKDYYELRSSVKHDDDDEYQPRPQFIHLDEATLLRENGAPLMTPGTLWRGKISSVIGFTMGTPQSN